MIKFTCAFLVYIIATYTLEGAESANLIKNGSFEQLDEGGTFARDWGVNRFNAEGELCLDKENASDGNISVQIETTKQLKNFGFVGVGASAWFPALSGPMKLRVTCAVSSVELTQGALVVMAGTQKNQTLWKTVWSKKGTFDWQTVKAEIEIPAGADYFSLSFRNSGSGVLWIDDVKASWVE